MRIDKDYNSLIKELNKRTKEYDEGHPTITDKEWDDLYFEIKKQELENNVISTDSPTQSISYEVVNELEKITHEHPMLSLPKTKSIEEVSNISTETPEWFQQGVKAALLAPTAVNQQKFFFKYIKPTSDDSICKIEAKRGFSLVGYTKIDLGICKYHFEIGAQQNNFEWV